MSHSDTINYTRIEKAIRYIRQNTQQQPSLDDIAAEIGLSPFYCQRLFQQWAGISPKKFLQYTSIEYAKYLLRHAQSTTLHTANDLGLSSSSRLHDLFITIEKMTPGDYKNGGEALDIAYGFFSSPFGEVTVASSPKGICYVGFYDDPKQALHDLYSRFPNAKFKQHDTIFHRQVNAFLNRDYPSLEAITLHLHGSDFQIKVWEALLKIPEGKIATYQQIASTIQMPRASRAVGSAIGRNPISILIPCHRVIRSDASIGGYMWGIDRKRAILTYEAANSSPLSDECD